jgi:hypothetical protein
MSQRVTFGRPGPASARSGVFAVQAGRLILDCARSAKFLEKRRCSAIDGDIAGGEEGRDGPPLAQKVPVPTSQNARVVV